MIFDDGNLGVGIGLAHEQAMTVFHRLQVFIAHGVSRITFGDIGLMLEFLPVSCPYIHASPFYLRKEAIDFLVGHNLDLGQ